MSLFENIRNEKAPRRIFDQIRTAILEGRLKPGDKLPVEQELTAFFGVSRQTLREALRALEIIGLLEIRAGSGGGAFVSTVDLDTTKANLANFLYFQNLSIGQLSEIRKALEPFAVRLAIERMTDEDLEKLRVIHEQCRKRLADREFEELMVTGVSFHRCIAHATQNPLLFLILDMIENMLTDVKRALRVDLDFSRRFVACHDAILSAVEARDPDRAETAMFHDVSVVETEMIRLAQRNQAREDH